MGITACWIPRTQLHILRYPVDGSSANQGVESVSISTVPSVRSTDQGHSDGTGYDM